MWEKSGSQVMAKIFLASQIPVFCNRQYLINGLRSDSEFLHIDRHK